MIRTIIHLDLDAFYCAVEERKNPELAGKPFAVGGRPEARGVVASCSYAARMYGVRSAMPMARALRLCPMLIILPGRHREYSNISQQVMQILSALTPHIERVSIDEAFIDVSELSINSEALASQIQSTIGESLGLPCSLGVATNKLVAKIATDVGKAAVRGIDPPKAITVVQPGEEATFLAPLPVQALWGVGPKTAERLKQRAIYTIGDLAQLPETELVRQFGINGHELALHARGIDNSPIYSSHEIKSISQEFTYPKDVSDEKTLRQTLRKQASQIAQRLAKSGLQGSTVKLKIRWPNFKTITHQATLSHPTDLDEIIYTASLDLLKSVWAEGNPVRLIGIGVSSLKPPQRQLSLWGQAGSLDPNLQQAIEDLKERFGKQVVQPGREFLSGWKRGPWKK